MKRNKNGDYEMNLETYKAMLEDSIYGETANYLKPETIQEAKAKLKEIEQMEMSNTQ